MAKKIPATERFAAAAAERGCHPDVVRFPADTRTAVQAAAALECDVAQIVKSLVFLVGEHPVVVLTSGTNVVDLDALAAELGETPVRADAAAVRDATGFAIGGVPPFGHPVRHRTLIDPHLATFDTVWAAAGAPDSVFEITTAQLIEITGAQHASSFTPAG